MIPRLWYISDRERGTGGRDLVDVIRAAHAGGVEAVILREPQRDAREIGSIAAALAPEREHGLALLISRRLDLARAFTLDGVHLARDAVPVREARGMLGADAWIGYSAHSGDEARQAAAESASYVTLSPIYETDSKPGLAGRGAAWLAEATRELRIPALALGGVTASRVRQVLGNGAWGVAVVSAIGAAKNTTEAADEFRKTILETTR